MARSQRPSAQPSAAKAEPASPAWSRWPVEAQWLQFNAALGMLGVASRHVAALTAARDLQGLGDAQRAAFADWTAWAEDVHRQWAELARLVPADAWTTVGWRLKPAAQAATHGAAVETSHDVFEQSKLGVEMLLRPWMPAPDLDHTDEFVA